MNTQTLLQLIQDPGQVDGRHVEALREELGHYPYFQAAQALLAKAQGTSEAIKTAAAYTANRAVLMRLINSRFNPDVNLPNIDHLDIQPEDLNAFDKLSREDDDSDDAFRSRLEALAEGLAHDEDTPVLAHDSDFDEAFEGAAFELPDDVGADEEMDGEPLPALQDLGLDDEPAGIFEEPQAQDDMLEVVEAEAEPLPEEEAEEPAGFEGLDPELMANMLEAKKRREAFLQDTPAEAAPAEAAEEVPEEKKEAVAAVPAAHWKDEEDEEVSDPELMESLAALRKSREAALKRQEAESQRQWAEAERLKTAAMADAKRKQEEAQRQAAEEARKREEAAKRQEEESARLRQEQAQRQAAELARKQEEEAKRLAEEARKREEEEAKRAQKPLADDPYEYPVFAEPNFAEAEPKPSDKPDIRQPEPAGLDDSLFALDAWLDDEPAPTAPISNSFKKQDATIIKAPKEALQQPAEPEPEEDSMTLEERIKSQNSIINSFMERSPKMPSTPPDRLDAEEQREDLALQSMGDSPVFVSENLASIMVRQGKYEQAIKIYQQLMLKYPDKNSYFADLIENLENKTR